MKELLIELPASVVCGRQVFHISQSKGYPEGIENVACVHDVHNILEFEVLQYIYEDIVSEPRCA